MLDAATEQPVTKFRVGIGPYSGADSFYADYPGMKDYADANGRFTLELSEESIGAVKVEADDYAAQVERLPEAQNGVVQVVLRLKPSAALHGVLVTPDGAPVAGGTVAISSGQPGGMPTLKNARLVDTSRQGKVVTTDAAGAIRPAVAPGNRHGDGRRGKGLRLRFRPTGARQRTPGAARLMAGSKARTRGAANRSRVRSSRSR